jgi:dienelactone hydrolase
LVNGKAPAVLVLHILDGRMRIARGIARVLANKGMHAFVMHMPGYGRRRDGGGRRPDAAQFFSRAHQAVADARRARDAIAATPGVDPVSISIQGTSLGAFIAALAAAIDDGFDRTFLMLAGGDLPDMFVNGRRDTAVLRAQMHAAGFKDAELARMLRTIDPEVLAHRLPAGRTWLYSARGDTVVPAANARALGKAANLDEQHHLWFSGDHYTCALHLPAILAHMVERLR